MFTQISPRISSLTKSPRVIYIYLTSKGMQPKSSDNMFYSGISIKMDLINFLKLYNIYHILNNAKKERLTCNRAGTDRHGVCARANQFICDTLKVYTDFTAYNHFSSSYSIEFYNN